jgi:hypothetical protein
LLPEDFPMTRILLFTVDLERVVALLPWVLEIQI